MTARSPDFVGFDPTELDYFGCKPVIDAEHAYLRRRRQALKLDPPPEGEKFRPTGLAFSGGGIRSASFCLGAMQALAEADRLKHFDYLSTVSGGSYIGTTLSWLQSQSWPHVKDAREREQQSDPDGAARTKASPCMDNGKLRFDCCRACFPLASEPMARDDDFDSGVRPPEYQGRLLAHLRQNASYLAPGNGVTIFSLLATMLRNALFGGVLVGSLFAAVYMLAAPHLYDPAWLPYLPGFRVNDAFKLGLILLAGFFVQALVFSPLSSVWIRLRTLFSCALNKKTPDQLRYKYRHFADRLYPLWLIATVGLLVLGIVPKLHTLAGMLPWSHKDSLSWTGLAAGLGGLAATLGSFFATQHASRVRFVVFALAGYLLLPLAFLLALFAMHQHFQNDWTLAHSLGLAAAVLVMAYFTDVNALSLHRYYRDRLMETFMPWVPDALRAQRKGCSHPAVNAYPLASQPTAAGATLPLHLINTHVVLAGSTVSKFKQRGGDNFVFSPIYSGSNATGWAKTDVRYRKLSLASIMAMSGAAVNPDAGIGGCGPTRQSWLAWPMRAFNLRLGYWIRNPAPTSSLGETLLERLGMPFGPNALWPGLRALQGNTWLKESRRVLEITDGGHFENLGIYELLRRRCQFIVACDAGDDRGFTFGDLNNVLEKARVDFGVRIILDGEALQGFLPRIPEVIEKHRHAQAYSTRPWLKATLRYHTGETGQLLLVTTLLTREHTVDLSAYQRANPDFPDQTTGDQFFDELQFEAYRELGFQSVRMALRDANLDTLWPSTNRAEISPDAAHETPDARR